MVIGFIWIALGTVTALAVQANGRSFIGCITGRLGLIAVPVMENLNNAGPEEGSK
jgi:hypothetical protein